MAEISEQELEQLRKAAKREETRKRKAREASKKHKEKRLEQGFKRISFEVNIDNFNKHKENGDVPVGIVWCPAEMVKSAVKNFVNMVYKQSEGKWQWMIEE